MARHQTQPPLLAPQCHATPAAARSAYLAPPSVPVQDLRTQRMNVHLALHFRNTPRCADIPARPARGFPLAATDRHRRDFCICRPGHLIFRRTAQFPGLSQQQVSGRQARNELHRVRNVFRPRSG